MEERQRTHRFFDRFTIISAILLMLIGLLAAQALGSLMGRPIGSLTGEKNLGDGIGIAVASFLILLLYKFWFRPEFEGNLKGGDLKLGFKISIIFIVYWITIVPLEFAISDSVFGAPTIGSIFMAIMAGTSEEVAFRGLPLSYLMRQWREEKHVLTALIFTAVVFGVVHLSNIVAGGNPGSVVAQTISATGMGVLLAAVYLRCGNLLVTIIIHTIHDIIAFTDVSGVQDGIVVGSVGIDTVVDLGTSVVLAIIGFWLVRPAKRGEIRALWDKKWGI